ncbi:MAG: hypothetical protein N3A66_11735, partial [Planctomycetota bacterium]|nr:hypothetical protein [Planctomycetota bacterium]
RPETNLLHRRWYRRYVVFPKDLAGRRFSLHFSAVNYLASVFVNGKLCGTHRAGYVPFAIDITDAIKPGEANEILIGIKGIRYFRHTPDGWGPQWPKEWLQVHNCAFLAPGNTGWESDTSDGIQGSVWLEAHGAVTGRDIFVQSKYKDKRLIVSVEVDNRTAKQFGGKVRFKVKDPDKDGAEVMALGEKPLALAAGETAIVEVQGSAEGLIPWWPKQAKLYTLRAEIIDAENTLVDTLEDTFGFREITLENKWFRINGKRCNFRKTLNSGPAESLEEYMEEARLNQSPHLRLPDASLNHFSKDPVRSMLRYMDRAGMPVRFNSMINGMFFELNIWHPEFWKNATIYFREWIKAYRNHPSIIVWVAENELDL